MCGIAGIAGRGWDAASLHAMLRAQHHRGPDDEGVWMDRERGIGLANNRLAIIDLTANGHQPMASADGTIHVVLNGEIYNYLELRAELAEYPYRSRSDTEVVLAAYERWGERCLDHLVGMFALAVWDGRRELLLCARDRFGVKPFYYHVDDGGRLRFASEIKALRAGGVAAAPDEHAWRQYLGHGLYDHSERTFFRGIRSLPAGHVLRWARGRMEIERWYDLPSRVLGAFPDTRDDDAVMDEYLSLLEESVRLRFRADVPVGINLSGGLDSSLLLALVRRIQGESAAVAAFTFTCGDARYDETPWVTRMLAETGHPWHCSTLTAGEVTALAPRVASAEDEPYGGVPSLAYSRVFEDARAKGVIVLLDGQGLDEQWAGYDYYARPAAAGAIVQGSRSAATRDDLLAPSFFDPARDARDPLPHWSDVALLNRRLQDVLHAKIPRALRFNDRISMMHSCELREPFLDHRLVELALRQPARRLIQGEERKVLLRRLAAPILPPSVRLAPKRPVQTPQAEWLAGPLASWVEELAGASALYREWYRPGAVTRALESVRSGATDNSFAVWQILSLALWDGEVLGSTAAPAQAVGVGSR